MTYHDVVALKFGDSRDHDTDESLETVLTKGNPPLLSLPFKILEIGGPVGSRWCKGLPSPRW